MFRASSAMEEFSSQAAMMQKQVVDQLAKGEEEIKAQKAAFEKKLTAQQKRNEAAQVRIEVLRHETHSLDAEIAEARQELHEAKQANDDMRGLLMASESKVTTAHDFIEETLRRTDTSHTDLDKVLRPHQHEVSLTRLMDVANTELSRPSRRSSSHARAALLQLDDKSAAPRPDDYVAGVSKRIAELQDAQEAGRDKLKGEFLKAYQNGEQRFEELQTREKELKDLKAKLSTTLRDVRQATELLEDNRKTLVKNLGGLRAFAQKLDKALSSAEEEKLSGKSQEAKHMAETEANEKGAKLAQPVPAGLMESSSALVGGQTNAVEPTSSWRNWNPFR